MTVNIDDWADVLLKVLKSNVLVAIVAGRLKVHKIEIFFGFDFLICIISLLVMSKY